MNCKQAKGLFSARVDGELSSLEERELREHLTECEQGCAERWVSFEATVQLVHSLPMVEPDPNFVGQVLDRVRGYEAGFVRPRVSVRRSLRGRMRDFWDEHLAFPLPARLVSVGVLGLAVGFVLASGIDWRPLHGSGALSASSLGHAGGDPVAAQVSSSSNEAAGDPTRPFADLAGDLSVSGGARTQDDSIAQDPTRLATPQSREDGPVRIVKSDGRPQITF